ncbi:MAG: HD domain-containing phosphohydrolase [Endomicrobiia bacterium]|nr:HD domain-containing phosphohydrolase [Endomicrobiia bacterium]
MPTASSGLLIVVSVVLVWLFAAYRRERKSRGIADVFFKNSIQKLQKQLNTQRADLDNLLALLMEIHEFGISASGSASKSDLSELIIKSACKLMRSENGSLMIIDPRTNELSITASVGLPDDVVTATKMKIGEGIAGRVAKTGKPLFVDNIETDIRFLKASNIRYPSKSFLSVPLKVKERVTGVLNVSSGSDGRVFEERDIHLITILADVGAITLENVGLYTNLQKFYMDMVETISRMIDAKDSYTHEHADRARKYAKLIARKLNLPKEMVRHIEYAALMHDIGKIGITENILRKPGKLTSEEMDIIRKHPAIGNKIISPVTFLNPVAPIILYHQEWYNGKGYPEGLKEEEIPLGARIVAVIDAYDAMCSDRPYRKAMTKEYAVNELKRGAGFQFDPKVVKAFVEVLEEDIVSADDMAGIQRAAGQA